MDTKDLAPLDPELSERAQSVLTVPEYNMTMSYIGKGGSPLSPETSSKFFELFLNGSDIKEIYRLNKAFPYESILWARVKYKWDEQKDEYIIQLQRKIKEKVIKTQLETTGLLSDILSATIKKNGDSIKKYIQTGNDEDLAGALKIDSIKGLLSIVDGLQKITGQANTVNVNKKETLNVNVKTNVAIDEISPESAAEVLKILAEAKRKKARER